MSAAAASAVRHPSTYSPIIDRPRRSSTKQSVSIDFHAEALALTPVIRHQTNPNRFRHGRNHRNSQIKSYRGDPYHEQIAIAQTSSRASHPAGSFFGGFRTTAPTSAAPSRRAVIRNPSQKRSLSTTILMRDLATPISPTGRPDHASAPPRRSQTRPFAALKSP